MVLTQLTSRTYSSVASTAQRRSLSPLTPVRSHVRPVDRDEDFVCTKNPASPGVSRQNRGQSPDAAPVSGMLREPDTRTISSDQLAAEVNGIYAGLVLLESKSIEYDSTQKEADLSQEQYHALFLFISHFSKSIMTFYWHPSTHQRVPSSEGLHLSILCQHECGAMVYTRF